jgi:hypothetical protein
MGWKKEKERSYILIAYLLVALNICSRAGIPEIVEEVETG